AHSQNISNEGTEFWAVFPTHDPSQGGNLASIKIYITSKTGSRGIISCGGQSLPFTVGANGLAGVVVPRPAAYIEGSQSNSVIPNKAIHIQVNSGEGKIAVYSHIFAGRRSAASLILPVASLGQKYHSMNYRQDPGGHNFLVLAATEPNTQLIIHNGAQVIRVSLENAGDVYQFMPQDGSDLTGVYVEIDPNSPDNCNKRFAAFSGSTSNSIGPCTTGRDPLFQQLYPISSWGKSYGIVPFLDRRYIIRIVAQEDNTRVQFNGQSITLNKGQYWESPQLIVGGFVTADKNVSVAQYSLSQDCSAINGRDKLGDPEMVLLNPVEFNINSVTLFSSTDQDIQERYINVFMKTSATGSFSIDGQTGGYNWTVVPGNPEYSFLQLTIFNTQLRLAASEGFNAIAYGFGSTESYAYSAGTNLAASNYLRINNKVTNQDSESACINQPSDFKIFLPAAAEEITWILDGGAPVVGSIIPTGIRTDASGTLTYEYTYSYGQAFAQLAQHEMVVKVKLPTVGSCIGNEYVYNYSFTVDPLPIADFRFTNLGCEFDGTSFMDMSQSQISGKSIGRWIWDFGDGSPLVYDQNPVHRFPGTGTYIVKLQAGTATGCLSDVLERTISLVLVPSPVVVFDPIPDICVNSGLYTVNSARETKGVSGSGVYSGRGITSDGVFDPMLAGVGVHEITYTYIGDRITEGNTFCQDIQRQLITVAPIPIVSLERDFYILVDGAKPFSAVPSGPPASYKWSPAIGLDRDDVLNPVIKGEVDRVYTLTATTATGCVIVETVSVHVLDGIKVPNIFSPNGDGINDVWAINYIDSYPNATVKIFNRYGTVVFSSKGYLVPFDGKYQNQDLPVESYYYLIDPGNGKPKKTGSLTIIR
ncbi:MAG: T9SS type B sorting domain-containing protein, partial [Pedobacter sp.]